MRPASCERGGGIKAYLGSALLQCYFISAEMKVPFPLCKKKLRNTNYRELGLYGKFSQGLGRPQERAR